MTLETSGPWKISSCAEGISRELRMILTVHAGAPARRLLAHALREQASIALTADPALSRSLLALAQVITQTEEEPTK